MYFDMSGNTTVDRVGSKTATVKTTGHEKQHFTIVLACQANEKHFVQWLSSKRKDISKESFPPSVIAKVHSKGWINE